VLTPAYLGSLLVEDLVVVDVGARWGAGERWRPFGPRVKVVGFDPDEQECARLAANEPDVTYMPLALGAKAGRATLYRTVEPGCSSLYPPLEGLAAERPALRVIRPDGEETVGITTLDDWLSASPLDEVHVLKLDTQGSELGVLEGAQQALIDVRVLQIEVELNPIYAGQPLFGDVDRFLRDRGFVLWRLGNLTHYGLADGSSDAVVVEDRHFFDSRPVEIAGGGGQLFWGEAYYVAADLLESGRPVSKETGVRDACSVAAFGFVDLAASRLGAAGLPVDSQ
jgi:FkbM family methyltransferase